MSTAIATGRGNGVSQGQFSGIGLAIPISMIDNVVDQLIDHGEVIKGYLGISMRNTEDLERIPIRDPMLQATAKNFQGDGVVVEYVSPQSPAELVGLRIGDVITQFAGQRIESVAQLKTLIASRQPNESVSVDAWRPSVENKSGQVFSVQVVIEQLKPETNSQFIVNVLRSIGVKKLATSTEAMAQQFQVPFERGVMVEEIVASSSVAAILPPGTLIVEVFGQKIAGLDDFYTRINRKLRSQNSAELMLGVRQQNGEVAQLRIPLP